MEQNYLCNEKIDDFNRLGLTIEPKLLTDKIILNEELKKRCEGYGLCKKCNQPNTDNIWCHLCNAKQFQQNFENWTSGNSDIDKLIQESQLEAKNRWEKIEWIEYDRFEDIKYITKGGFGTIYKAYWKDGWIRAWDYETDQWIRVDSRESMIVALKYLNNSNGITLEFLNEIKSHLKMNNTSSIIKCYGITKDPKTNDFVMVMEYAKSGSLRQKLNNHFNSLDWKDKVGILRDIVEGLNNIHKEGLIHQDFHTGNILDLSNYWFGITDLGLCKSVNEKSERYDKNIFGVLPYVAPEVLRGKDYTQASDIYSFGIIIYEVFNGLPPYHDTAHEEFLAVKICQGLRPSFNNKVPQLIEDIAKQCVDVDPLKRPTAKYLSETFHQWIYDEYDEDSEIYKQMNEEDKFSNEQPPLPTTEITELTYTTHPQAVYVSRLLNFKNLPEPKNTDDEYSDSTIIDFIKENENINTQELKDTMM